MKDFHYTSINLNQLCGASRVLPISYPLASPVLLASLQKIGLITPLLVQPLSAEKYPVICGQRRLAACRELGIKAIPCQILSEPADELQTLLLNLHDNLASRGFNPIEQSLVINKLEMFLPPQQVIADYLPLLGLNPHAGVREKLLPLSALEEPVKQAVVKGRLHPDVAYRLACLSASERRAIFELLEKIHLSTSKQQELIANLEALKYRENTSIERLLAEPALWEISHNPELSLNQRGEQIRRLIHQRRSPLFSRAQQTFKDYKRELGLPPDIQLTPPPFFEKDEYKLSFSFSSPEELKRRLAKLEQIADTPALRQIMKLGKEI